ncbi:TonB-dependent receptor [Myxococcota bacterium]|nr:TonB-dependent receptor [Myxococcota bacterium]
MKLRGVSVTLVTASLVLSCLTDLRADERAPPAARGRLRTFVFTADGRPVNSARVTSGVDVLGETDAEGMSIAELDAGTVRPTLTLPGRAPFTLTASVAIVAGQETELIVTLPASGDPIVDVETPDRDVRTAENIERGRVRGVVVSAETGAPVANARVFVRGARGDARSDADGRFELELPVGERALTIIHPNHSTGLANVTVSPSAEATVEVRLDAKSVRLAEVVVLAPRIEGSTLDALQAREASATVADVLGAEQISKSGDSDAAAALSRVTGITVVGGRYVYVRGLGERYSSVQLDGSMIPSPDPERRVVPLDLFPASAISGITVQKTHSPILPGEFGGGMVQLATKGVPEELTLSVGASGRLVHGSSFSTGLDHAGGSTDVLGFGAGSRALPSDLAALANVQLVREGDRFNPGLDDEELERLGEQLDPVSAGTPRTLPPDFGLSVEVGGPFELFGMRAGGLFGVDYSNAWFLEELTFNSLSIDGEGNLGASKAFRIAETQHEIALSGLGTLALELAKGHSLKLTAGVFRISSDQTQRTSGIDEDVGGPVEIHVLEWTERMVSTNQLRGTHVLSEALGLGLDWRYQLSFATSDQPNRRSLRYFDQAGTLVTANDGNERLWAALTDRGHQLGAGLTLPFTLAERESTLRAGVDLDLRSRDVSARRYYFRRMGSSDASIAARSLPPNALFTPETIDPEIFQLEETTRSDDNYLGDERIFAAYGQVELAALEDLSVLFGARIEASAQSIDLESAVGRERSTAAELARVDVLPSITATWGFFEDMQLRAAVARTVNRPNFRELSPGAFIDQTRGLEYRGNPELERAVIHHVDLRWEWYPSPAESMSIAAFGKWISDPIESSLQLGANPVARPINTDGATNFGVELEARRDLSFVGPGVWENLWIAGNLTLVRSRVTLGTQAGVLTSESRALQGQSPYAVNAQLGYDDPDAGSSVTVLFNVFGPRISDVGVLGVPDVFEQPQPALDVVVKQKLERFDLSLKLQNLLDPAVRFSQREPSTGALVDRERYERGRRVTLSLSLALE